MILAALITAQLACGPYAVVVQRLESQRGETRWARALNSESAIIETWVNNRTGSWTLLSVTPDGQACMIGSGQHFRAWPMGVPA